MPGWLAIGAPSLAGVKFLGAAFHQGRVGNTPPPLDATQDVEISHEAELSASRRLILTTDERGGGVSPPGATCATGANEALLQGNGGIHAYRVRPAAGVVADWAERSRYRMGGVRPHSGR